MSFANVLRGAAGLLGVLIAAHSMAATPDQQICRDQPRPGSRIVTRICATQAEWLAADKREAVLQRAAGGVEYPVSAGTAVVTSVSTAQTR